MWVPKAYRFPPHLARWELCILSGDPWGTQETGKNAELETLWNNSTATRPAYMLCWANSSTVEFTIFRDKPCNAPVKIN